MISQRDINQFFTIIDVLSNPEKMKQEIEVLSNMRASVDADLQRVGEESQKARSMQTEAQVVLNNREAWTQTLAAEAAELNKKAAEIRKIQDEQVVAAGQQVEIKRLLDARAKELDAREEEFVSRASKQDSREAALQVREEGLRKKEADYTARMSKLRQIAE